MSIIDVLVEQCRKPTGMLGKIMTKTMNVMDSGLTKWAIEKIDCNSATILDIGCGGGETIYRLSKKNTTDHIDGIDYSEDAVKLSIRKNRLSIRNGTVNIARGEVTALPYKSERFEYVIAVRTHYFWEDLEKSFHEIYRVMKPKGTLVILSEAYKIQYHMKQYNTDDSIKDLLCQVGFQTVLFERRENCHCITVIK